MGRIIEIHKNGIIIDNVKLKFVLDPFSLCEDCALINEKCNLNCSQYCQDEGYYVIFEKEKNEYNVGLFTEMC